jgi:hypothetical protein
LINITPSFMHALLPQVQLQDMRAKLPELVDPKGPEQEHEEATGQQQQQDQQEQQQGQQGQQEQGGLCDIDDDELLQMQADAALVSWMLLLLCLTTTFLYDSCCSRHSCGIWQCWQGTRRGWACECPMGKQGQVLGHRRQL